MKADILGNNLLFSNILKNEKRTDSVDSIKLVMDFTNWSTAVKIYKMFIVRVVIANVALPILYLYLQSIVSFSPLVLFSKWRNKIS
jgi:hypothetical protein